MWLLLSMFSVCSPFVKGNQKQSCAPCLLPSCVTGEQILNESWIGFCGLRVADPGLGVLACPKFREAWPRTLYANQVFLWEENLSSSVLPSEYPLQNLDIVHTWAASRWGEQEFRPQPRRNVSCSSHEKEHTPSNSHRQRPQPRTLLLVWAAACNMIF